MKTRSMIGVVASLGLILVSTLAWRTPIVQEQQQQAPPQEQKKTEQAMTPAAVRDAAVAGYRKWGDARIAYDREALESMVAPDLYIQLADRRITGKEFLDTVSQRNPRAAMTRFDVDVLSVQKKADSENEWTLVICEKIEYSLVNSDVKGPVFYSLWVTRDGWRLTEDGTWLITYSEEIGHENWQGAGDGKAPIEGW
ncbi:MAG: hypothetical protein HND57_14070 [Planctomycetes bacterium]|nr:hypothetical protein [Planctomycetota bacterium]